MSFVSCMVSRGAQEIAEQVCNCNKAFGHLGIHKAVMLKWCCDQARQGPYLLLGKALLLKVQACLLAKTA